MQDLIDNGEYTELRHLPTKREHRESLHNWHIGHFYPYDLDKGFPQVVEDPSATHSAGDIIIIVSNLSIFINICIHIVSTTTTTTTTTTTITATTTTTTGEAVTTGIYDVFVPNRVFSSAKFIRPLRGADDYYHKYTEASTSEKAEMHLRKVRKDIEKQKLMKNDDSAVDNPDRLKRRVAHKIHDIQYDASQAKIQLMVKDMQLQQKGAKASLPSPDHVDNDDDDASRSSSGSSSHENDNDIDVADGKSMLDTNATIDKMQHKENINPKKINNNNNNNSDDNIIIRVHNYIVNNTTTIVNTATNAFIKNNQRSIVPTLESPVKQKTDEHNNNSRDIPDPDSQPMSISLKPHQYKPTKKHHRQQQQYHQILSNIYNNMLDFISDSQSDGIAVTLRRAMMKLRRKHHHHHGIAVTLRRAMMKLRRKHHHHHRNINNYRVDKLISSTSETKRKEMIQKLEDITTKINSIDYHNETVQLHSFELPYQEFLHINKKKKKRLMKEIQQMEFILYNRFEYIL